MSPKRFKKTKEDFVCGNCGINVIGDGYTNHCPACLWSKHVDVNPGDRASLCGGMMKPIKVERDGRSWAVIQRCELCGHKKRNKSKDGDNIESFLGR